MKDHTIHKNLSTSFVDLAALVHYLRGLQFVGSIRVELGSYQADIVFTDSNTIRARERDQESGTFTVGSEAFKRILERARKPHGRINVYRSALSVPTVRDRKVHIDSVIFVEAQRSAETNCDRLAGHLLPRAKKPIATEADEWKNLLDLTAELLLTIDRSLAKGGLRFAEAFMNACALVSEDAPFLDPNRGLFEYKAGNIRVGTPVSRERLLDAVTKALARIFDRLRDDPQFSKLRLFTNHRIQALMLARKADYARFRIADRLEPLLQR